MKAVFFDLDGTLLDDCTATRHGTRAIFNEIRAPEVTFDEFHAYSNSLLDRYFNAYLAGEISFEKQRIERMKAAFAYGGQPIDDRQAESLRETYRQAYELHWRAFEEVPAALRQLDRYRLGIVTNGEERQQLSKLTRMGLQDLFSPIVISSQLGKHKPAAEIFLHACERAGAKPAECVFVGDNFEVDAIGSRNAGLHPVWINRHRAKSADSSIASLSDLSGLPALIASLV